MRPERFQIEVINRSVLSFFPGETIQGVVQVIVGPTQECVFKGIRVIFKGKATVRWTEQVGNTRAVYWQDQTFFDHKEYLLGTGETEAVLPPGIHEYPFQFTLPQELPSSFVGCHGSVRYKIQAEMVKGSFKSNYKAKVPYTVNSIVDLNMDPLAAEPLERRKYKNLCCLCCKSGTVGFNLTLPKAGYVSGEFISFSAEFSNQSGRPVKSVTAYLVQKVTYRTKRKSKTEYEHISKIKGPSIDAGDTEIWNVNTIQVPPLPPTTVGYCIIDVQYLLKIEMHLTGSSINLRHRIPLIIGSIPFRSTFAEIARNQSNFVGDGSSLNYPTSAPPPYSSSSMSAFNSSQLTFFQNSYPDLPPPSYAQAMIQEGKFDESNEGQPNPSFEGENPNNAANSIPLNSLEQSNKFAPNYITYGWNS